MSDIEFASAPRTMFSWKIVKLVFQDMKKWEKEVTYERAERSPWVRVMIVDSEWRICISREHRTELNDWAWWYDYRLPGGKVIDTLVEYEEFLNDWWDILEAAAEAAKREAKEEVWIKWDSIRHLHTSWCGTTMKRDLYYFELKDISIWEQELDGMEHIDYDRYTLDTVKKMCMEGEINEDRSVAVLLRYIDRN